MSAELLQTIQRLIGQTTEAMKPTDYIIGVVETVGPLSIRIEQKEIVSAEFLELTDAVRDYDVDIEVMHVTEKRAGGGGYAEYASHDHDYRGRKKIRVYNGLHVGEPVYLLRQAGGQSFLVLSRVKNHANLTGQWG